MPHWKRTTKQPQKQEGKMPAPPKQKEKVKEKIPLEIKNAREWDPNRRREDESSESSESETEDDYEDWPQGPFVFGGPQVGDDSPNTSQAERNGREPRNKANDRFQPVSHGKHNNRTQVNGNGKARPPKRPKRVFNYTEDNLGKAAYRKKLPPGGKFVLHKDCHEIEPNRKRLYDMLQEMGVRLGSFIRPPQDVKDRELLIWGNAAQFNATIAALNAWLSPRELMGRKSMAKENFASEYSSIGTKYKALQKKMMKDAAIQRFQQVPEAGKSYPFNGSFIWPVDEIRPEDILGSSCEAFDPIRFQHQCHILFDNKEECFKVMTDDPKSVEQTLLRIEGTMKEYVAKSSRRVIEHLIEPPDESVTRKDIKMEEGPSFGSSAANARIPVLTGETLNSVEQTAWVERAAELELENHRRTEHALLRCIPNLVFYRGQVHMRVHFGKFALTVYKTSGDSLPFESFVTNMTKPGTRGDLIKDLYNNIDTVTIMNQFYKADDIFQPLDNSTYSLKEVAPSFSARFQFQEVDQPAIQLDIELNTSGLDEALYEKTHALWTRVDRRDNAVPLSIFMVRLEGEASWKLQASTENTIDQTRVQPRMTAFADSVKLKKIPKSKVAFTGEKIFQWEKDLPGTMRPISFEQKTSFKYRLVHDVDWVFEISRYDVYGDLKDESLPTKTCWAAAMWNTEWDATLAANAGLGIGEAATWEPNIATFFPATGEKAPDSRGVDPGIMKFLTSVQTITDFLDSTKKETTQS
ncbi:hypothetical protein P7C71_g3972, partial [Lecanoromycetidae sp. Uapishka_2]